MRKITILILFLLVVACASVQKEGKAKEMPAQIQTEEVIEEPITCCCEIQDTYMFLRKTECQNCVEDNKCLQTPEKTQAEKEKEIVDIAMGKTGYPASDLTARVCCVVPMPRARMPYEKAFDTTKQRCMELKGTGQIWEKCYEEVCCDRIGRLVKRKFMECKNEGGTIVEKEKCL